MKKIKTFLSWVACIIIFTLAWKLLILIWEIPSYNLPAPEEVLIKFFVSYPVLAEHAIVTLLEIIAGFSASVFFGSILSFLMVYRKVIRRIIFPMILGLQSVPKMIFVPFLLMFLGFGFFPKIVIAALVGIFPIVINFTKGLEATDPDMLDLVNTYPISEGTIFWKVKIPSALPFFYLGLKTSLGVSIGGVILAEFYMSDKGLAYLIWQNQTYHDLPMTFDCVIILVTICLVLSRLIRKSEKKRVHWKEKEEEVYTF